VHVCKWRERDKTKMLQESKKWASDSCFPKRGHCKNELGTITYRSKLLSLDDCCRYSLVSIVSSMVYDHSSAPPKKIGGRNGWKIKSWIFESWIYTTPQVISKLIPTDRIPNNSTQKSGEIS
jgi:hypothetical protein